MTRRTIPGHLDLQAMAILHRPHDPDLLAREARALADQGLTNADIGQALGISPKAVAELLRPQGVQSHE